MTSNFRLIRSPQNLLNQTFDVLIIGGGIFGACAAWDAALRGLSVGLIEGNDFGSGASANSFKMVHGGIRYIQHLDVPRVRDSCRERSALLRIAPHLVKPLPIAIPTYGWTAAGKPFLAAGMNLYDLCTIDRNRGIQDSERRIPWSRTMGPAEVKRLFPGIPDTGLTGAAVFSDAQMYNPTRLVLAFIQSAVAHGAVACNYLVELRAQVVLSAAGPWTEQLLSTHDRLRLLQPSAYSRDACFVVRRKFDHPLALAVMGRTKDPGAVLSRPSRHLFIVPWRDYSLMGVWHKVVPPEPDKIGIEAEELTEFVTEFNEAYPALDLDLSQITQCNWGLVPFGENETGATDLRYGKRSRLIDHARVHGITNLVSLTGIRYTMGRGDAARAMRVVARKLGADPSSPDTEHQIIAGGDFTDFEQLVQRLRKIAPETMDDATIRCLAHNHGTTAQGLLTGTKPELLECLPGTQVLRAEVVKALREEMAVTLADVVLRRTDLGTGSYPGDLALTACAHLVAHEL
ncbi:MAG: glycerol-3-phosphate dehydrogenase/oxidase, partial [Planctomycetota bacterium]